MPPPIDDLNMLQRGQLLWGLMRDERVSPWLKRLGPMAILAYVISPIDLIPDFLLGPGQVDDLGVVAIGMVLLLRLIVRFAPDAVVSEHVSRVAGIKWTQEDNTAYDDDTIETTGRVRRSRTSGNG